MVSESSLKLTGAAEEGGFRLLDQTRDGCYVSPSLSFGLYKLP